jgi:cytochrome c peroxidase
LVAAFASAGAWQLAPSHARGTVGSTSDRAVIALGKRIFFDSTLSGSGRMSCASCHDPSHAYGPSNGLSVQLGGVTRTVQGARAVPSLRYVLNRTPAWYKEYISNPAERAREGNEPPAGGFGMDGRFKSLHEQAAFPLLAANEMANANADSVVAAFGRGPYAAEFRSVFGENVFADPSRAFAGALVAIERFELQDSSFHPYTSKFDRYLDGSVALSAAERRGLALFDDVSRGNCASCHVDRKGADGSHPLFTDYQFEALGVPRNPEIVANRNSVFFDEGVCGPVRRDQAASVEYCGMFKTPTLRNVATRGAFFHNGRFHSLREALEFYVGRDADPGRWYSLRRGRVERFDDLPPAHRVYVDTTIMPMAHRAGAPPVWSAAEIDDVVAFLSTLTDSGTQPAALTRR